MKSSVFVRLDKYRELYDLLGQIRSKLGDAKQILKKVKELKNQEDGELESWQNELGSVEQKLSEIHDAMSEK